MGLTWTMVLAAGLAAAAPAQAGEVTIAVTPERQSLAKSDNVVVTVTVTNASAATRYLLKWQTPFGPVEAPLFEVTRDGQPVRYLGIQVKRPPPAPSDYVALKPGASRSVRVELSALYDMGITGAYSVRWRDGATQLFSRPGLPAANALPASEPAAVWIAGRLPRGALETGPAVPEGAGLSFSRCSNAQQDAIAGAVQAAQTMAADADAYLARKDLGQRYLRWFGAVEAERSAADRHRFQGRHPGARDEPLHGGGRDRRLGLWTIGGRHAGADRSGEGDRQCRLA